MYNLDTRLTELKGVGPAVAAGLERLKLMTVRDLLLHYPHRWEDYSRIVTIANLKPGTVTIKARVEKINLSRTARRRVAVTEAILSDPTGTTRAVWFGQSYLVNVLREGQDYYFAGEFAFKSNNLALQNPSFTTSLESGSGGKIVPIYPETAGVNSKLLSKLVAQIIDLTAELPQVIPEKIVTDYHLLSKGEAVHQLHQPTSQRQLEGARYTLGFEELWLLVVTGLLIRGEIATEPAYEIPFNQAVVEQFVQSLPFKLTDSQRAAAWQIIQDMERPVPMNRLLAGDVGSGKTVVALLAAVNTIRAGYQVAMMAPTEILARQHWQLANQLLKPLDIEIELLTGSLKASEKQAAYDQLATGTSQLVIGTHALLNEKLSFQNLALVVIDEQHRFGVNQRTILKQKAKLMPHLLALTATPIPRSLALVVYSDLDITRLEGVPPGRKTVETHLYMEIERAKAYAQVDEQIAQGRQVFILCPQIDPDDTGGVKSVTSEARRLARTVFAHRRVALLHGKLSAIEKNRIMADFAAHKYDILITTTVVEVGVDIPNASVMMIENADRFGLAQLHQLRGRVGRGPHQSYCYLFADLANREAILRLQALERTTDGFRLAQIDLENRGAGEIYGTRQHGVLDLRMANLTDTKLVAAARAAAQSFVQTANVLEYPAVRDQVNQLKKVTTLD